MAERTLGSDGIAEELMHRGQDGDVPHRQRRRARPAGRPAGPWAGVLPLPNFRGLAPDIVAAAQQLARAGCPTLAVDFLHRVPLRFDDFYEQGPAALLSLDLG